jgi:hypothetical protein
MNEKCTRSPQFSSHPLHELFLSCVNSIISEWHSCLLACSQYNEVIETERFAKTDLLNNNAGVSK